MPHIPVVPSHEASSEVRAVYDDFHRRMQFPSPPNFIMTQGHSPSVARGTWELVKNVLVGGEIPRWQKEMIFVAISAARNCKYCEAAHIACCRMLGKEVSSVSEINLFADPALRTMIEFSLKCAGEPQALTGDDYDALREHGLSQSQIMELIGMSALAVYANIVADATAMEADAMFGNY